jgi:hypothetical protein
MKKKTMAVIHPQSESKAPQESEALDKPNKNPVKHHACLASDIAGSPLTVKNWRIPGAFELFPNAPSFRQVDKFYHHAPGGPLAVDDCISREAADRATGIKKLLCQRAGIRYLATYPDMTRHDAEEMLSARIEEPKEKTA